MLRRSQKKHKARSRSRSLRKAKRKSRQVPQNIRNHAAFGRYFPAAKEEARKGSKAWEKKLNSRLKKAQVPSFMSSSRKEKLRTKEKIRPKSSMILANVRTIMSTLMKMVTPWTALRYAGFANVSSPFMYTSNRKF